MTLSTNGRGDRVIEWLFALMMISWGTYLWLPFNTFGAPQYALLKAIGPEIVWGAFSISIGAVRMIALIINGHVRHTPIVRCVGAMFGALWWIVMTFLFLTGSPEPPAGVVWYPLFFCFEAYVVLRTGADTFMSGALERRPLPGYQ